MIQQINSFFGEKLNFYIVRNTPRHSIRFAKNYFGNKEIIAVEIGTHKGYNAKSILKELNVMKLYLIDPYEEYSDYTNSEPNADQQLLSNAERIAIKKLKKFKHKIIWLKKYSDDAVDDVVDNIDFVYIDGNHEYEYVIKDMENYYKKLNVGGILAGHDITSFPGVSKALFKFCNKYKLEPHITRTDWWIVKK